MKKKFDSENNRGRSRRLWIMAIFILAIVFSLIFFDYQPGKVQLAGKNFSSFFAKLKAYIHDEGGSKLKENQIANNKKDQEPEIHFEFYNVLPNMTVPVRMVEKTFPEIRVEKEYKDTKIKKVISMPTIFDDRELQDTLKNEFEQTAQYIIQMGVFRNMAGAEKLIQTLANDGLNARVMKISMMSGNAYSVQVGPVANKNDAVSIQRKLQKKGLNGIIKKL